MVVIRIETKQNFLTYGTQVFPFSHVSALDMFRNIPLSAGVVALTTQPFASTKRNNLGLNFWIYTTDNY